jgi:hypothetical protein
MTQPPLTATQRLDRRLAPYEPVGCPLPGCGADLYVNVTAAIPIVRSSTVADLSDPGNAVSTRWDVACTEGHVLLFPAEDTDNLRFGVSAYDEDDNDDVERLAALTGWEAGR